MFAEPPFNVIWPVTAVVFVIVVIVWVLRCDADYEKILRFRIIHLILIIPLIISTYGIFNLPYHLNFVIAAISILSAAITVRYLNSADKALRQIYHETKDEWLSNERLQEISKIEQETERRTTKAEKANYITLISLAAIQGIALIICNWGYFAIPLGVLNFSIVAAAATLATPVPDGPPFFPDYFEGLGIFVTLLLVDMLIYLACCGIQIATSDPIVEQHEVKLVSLQDSTYTNTSGLLYITSSPDGAYNYYRQDEEGNYHFESIPAEGVTVVLTEDEHKLVTTEQYYPGNLLSLGKLREGATTLYVPRGTIVQDFTLDVK